MQLQLTNVRTPPKHSPPFLDDLFRVSHAVFALVTHLTFSSIFAARERPAAVAYHAADIRSSIVFTNRLKSLIDRLHIYSESSFASLCVCMSVSK